MATATVLKPVSNDADDTIAVGEPYSVQVTIRGSAAILFHRWSNESVAAKSAAAKNSKAKKTDDLNSYVYRCDNGNLGLPGEYLRQSIIGAARFRQDPRSPRKSGKARNGLLRRGVDWRGEERRGKGHCGFTPWCPSPLP